MIVIRSVFEATYSQKMAETDFSHIFYSSLNLLHKNQILKNPKKAYAAICRPIALKRNASSCFKFN